jgi:hypothetical protein
MRNGKVTAARLVDNWREVLMWEGRMVEQMENLPYARCDQLLTRFVKAHMGGFNSTGSKDNSLPIVRLETRRVDDLDNMQRFQDQGDALCRAADYLLFSTSDRIPRKYFQRAWKIAEARGFFSAGGPCLRLGKLALARKRAD